MSRRALLSAALVLLLPAAARAHATSTGLARVTVEGERLRYRLTLVLDELPEEPRRLLAAAAGGDAAAAERVAEEARLRAVALVGAVPCRPGRVTVQGTGVGSGRLDVEVALRCPSTPDRLVLRDGWPGLLGEHHRTLLRLDGPGGPREAALSQEAPEATLEVGGGSGSRTPAGFFTLGLEHILSGLDHLLFLGALLLRGRRLRGLLGVITAFTLAHSLTLAAAVLGLVVVPARIVEPAIAASIVWVAVENLRGDGAPDHRWLLTFAFGLVHGFGFASALEGLALPPWRLAGALALFNLGIEAGQALVIAAALPLFLWLRRAAWERWVVRGASLAVALTGAIWFVQRIVA
ncbi:MAG: HupE/UreJ family protein [Deltaproteobacteria bacterium]|nr:HupE/UreJ family protein [Deltaproteobacteria bacterium]